MENTPVVAEVVACKQNVLFEVTPASRVLAGVLFIVLPFIGGWIGYTYGSNHSITETATITPDTQKQIVSTELDSQVSTTTDTSAQTALRDILFNGQKTGYTTDGTVVYFSHIEGNTNDEWVLSDKRIIVDGVEVKTFKVIASEPAEVGTLYAVDANYVYAAEKRLPAVDPKTVEVFGKGDAFLISNAGLFLGGDLKVEADKAYTKVYLAKQTEAFSPYYVYVHNTRDDAWFAVQGFNQTGKSELINAPTPSAIESLLYPSAAQ